MAVFLAIFYFLARLINLTKLPIFNDEAIYLDWGWRATNLPGQLFVSLYDAKQPLLVWIFGLFENILKNPLFAGRLVSIMTGFLTLLGIYFLAKSVFDKKVAFLAGIFYIAIPIFSFFDRQALMESSLVAVNVWSFYLFSKLKKTEKYLYAFLLGVLLGLGFFIKTTGLFFILSTFILNGIWFAKARSEKGKEILKRLVLVFYTVQFVLLPLYLQKVFWLTVHTNDRYALSIYEIIDLPLGHWLENLKQTAGIIFWYFTPGVSLLAILGLLLAFRKKGKDLIFWFFIQLFLFLITVRHSSPRYVVPFLPSFTILAAFSVSRLWRFKKPAAATLLGASLAFTSLLTYFQIVVPLDYFNILANLSPYSQKKAYVTGWPSGYGVPEVWGFLEKKGKEKPILVGVRLDFGNPENAIFTYFHKKNQVNVVYFDGRLMPDILEKNDCLVSETPFYFVSRDNQLSNLNKFLKEEQKFYKPEKKSFIGIYSLKDQCQGKTIELAQLVKRKR